MGFTTLQREHDGLSGLIEVDDTPVTILGLGQQDASVCKVNIEPAQAEDFTAPHSRTHSQSHDGPEPRGAGFDQGSQFGRLKIADAAGMLGDFTPCAGLTGMISHSTASLSKCFRTFNSFKIVPDDAFSPLRFVT